MDRNKVQEALKPITDGLFGKQRPVRYERPHFKVRPLVRMLQDLTGVDPQTIPLDSPEVMSLFQNTSALGIEPEDIGGCKLGALGIPEFGKQAVCCGREYAEKICCLYGVRSPEELSEAMGLKVEYPTFPENADRVLFAEFREPGNIKIYMDAVKKAHKFTERPEVKEVLTEQLDIKGLLLAHELFHFVEEKYKDEIFTKQEKIRLWSLGPLHNDSTVIVLSEIAAMAFAQAITGIPYSPYVMDVFLVYGYSPEEASGLYEEIMEYAGKIPCYEEGEPV